MMEEPVTKLSGSLRKALSCCVNIIMSVAKRQLSTIAKLIACRATFSKVPRLSPQYMGFSCTRSKPMSFAVSARSSWSPLIPKPAAEPSGFWSSTRAAAASSGEASSQPHAKASNHLPTVVGIALCMCVYPGIGTPSSAVALALAAAASSATRRWTSRRRSRAKSLIIVSDWSFRERPVWIFLPTSPYFSVMYCSMAVCPSSWLRSTLNLPSRQSSPISFSAFFRVCASSAVRTPILLSIMAWASEAWRSKGSM
mmetsp:Transcript_137356/g.342547  ORF Transcript_137356/g.342547 Transcript_137356/m.342547 type:complete len:254 (-) Transcript_137356:209-970(-)